MGYCLRKVKQGGLIIGDDCHADPAHKHHGVYRDVKEFASANRIRLLIDGQNIQFVATQG